MARKEIEDVFATVNGANDIVQTLLTEDMKEELNQQVREDCKHRSDIFLIVDCKYHDDYDNDQD